MEYIIEVDNLDESHYDVTRSEIRVGNQVSHYFSR